MNGPEDIKGYATRNAVRILILAALGYWVVYVHLMTESTQFLCGLLAVQAAGRKDRQDTLPFQLACLVFGIVLGVFRHEDAIVCIFIPAISTILWGIRYSRPLAPPPEKVAAPSLASMRFWTDASQGYQTFLLIATGVVVAAFGIVLGLVYGLWAQALVTAVLALDNPIWSFFRATPWLGIRQTPAEWPDPSIQAKAIWRSFYVSFGMAILIQMSVVASIFVMKAPEGISEIAGAIAAGVAIFLVLRAVSYRKELSAIGKGMDTA